MGDEERAAEAGLAGRSLRVVPAVPVDTVVGLLQELASLLSATGQMRWASLMGSLADEAAAVRPAGERRETLVKILSLYRGMGGLDDLVLQDGRRVRPEQRDLDDLCGRLHEQAVRERAAGGGVGRPAE